MDYGTAVNAKQSYHGNGGLVGQEVEQQTLAATLDDRLRAACHRIAKLTADMENLADRAFGSPPPAPQPGTTAQADPVFPAFVQVSQRLDTLERALGEAEEQFHRLRYIA